ncbi:HipA domain-containing protein [Leifsonia kafniensis]|uniref:HipA domain-containing protein n=1 Tax=Leifsonia kafniensis TaxID=475957 RepID=A0ABP7L4N4_9MICO
MAHDVVALEVLLHGRPAGVIQARGPSVRFYFFEQYINDPDRKVLGLRFEEDIRRLSTGQRKLPTWFSNLLPEGRLGEMMRAQVRDHETPAVPDLDLLAQLGSDLPGAVTVRAIGNADSIVFEDRLEPEDVSIIQQDDHDYDDQLFRFSIAGVGLKFSMLRAGERFTAPATGTGGDWIVKLPDANFKDLPVNEFATMTLASRVGIEVPEIRMVHRDHIVGVPEYAWNSEHDAYAIRRFDRGQSGPIHIEDMAQVRGYYPEEKYTGTFESVANLFYRTYDTKSVSEFVRRLAYSVLIGNGDAHLKNWSLIYRDGRKPTISPAYDIVSVKAYPEVVQDLGLKLMGKKQYDSVRIASFERVGERIGARDLDFGGIARQVIADVEKHWDEAESILSRRPALVQPIKDHFISMKAQLLG